jgi:hypothetical protein
VVNLASRFPMGQYYFFANEIPYLTSAKEEITTYLKRGAIGIGGAEISRAFGFGVFAQNRGDRARV